MNTITKSLRLHIGFFGRTNVGKSSILNLLAAQNVAITSEVAGTTTDVVEKAMELLPIGPVIFLDTAGVDDKSELGGKRIISTDKAFLRSDVILIVTENNVWSEYEESLLTKAEKKKIPYLIIVNKIDENPVSVQFQEFLKDKNFIAISAVDTQNRDLYLNLLKEKIAKIVPESFFSDISLTHHLLKENSIVVLVVPIDSQAPKGRLILPQVQTIRDLLDFNHTVIMLTDKRLPDFFDKMQAKIDLVICDSQVLKSVTEHTPKNIPITTFSILFSQLKGELSSFLNGVNAVDNLQENDKILIAESCTHHAGHEDIGRVKIPNWIRKYTNKNLIFEIYSGHDFPSNLSDYKLVVHCGGCMQNRQQMLSRIAICQNAQVPITNYGIIIAKMQNLLNRISF